MKTTGRKGQILDAAARVFSEKGYHRAKIEDIAARAGVGKGTVYEYFSSKRHLFEEVMDNVLETYMSQGLEAISGTKDPREKLKIFIKYQHLFFIHKEHIARLLMRSSGEIREDMVEKLMVYRTHLLKFVGSIIEEGVRQGLFREVDPYYAAILFMGVLQEAGTMMRTGQGISEEALDKMLDYYLHGIGK
ncbi:MAG: Transcriptional regulator, AcrR family [Firmicutes bacterium]|nr:Transcriptional regulator, AcrR family [Bacillota bacterium]